LQRATTARTADGKAGQKVRRHSLDRLHASMNKQNKTVRFVSAWSLAGPVFDIDPTGAILGMVGSGRDVLRPTEGRIRSDPDLPHVGSGRSADVARRRPSLPQKVEVSYSIQSACTQWIRQPPSFKRRLRTVNSNLLGKFTAVVYRLYISVNFLTRNQTSCKLHNILLAQCIKHFLNGSDIIPCSRNRAVPLPALQTFDCLHSVISHPASTVR
jgi:hypothetical protein